MLLRDVYAAIEWPTLAARLVELYPDQAPNLEGYHSAFTQLQALPPGAATDDELAGSQIHVVPATWETYEPGEPMGYDVSLVKDGDRYGIIFSSWDAMLDRELTPETLSLPLSDIASHLLFELTFMGYSTQEVAQEREQLLKDANAVAEAADDDETFAAVFAGALTAKSPLPDSEA